MKTSEFDQFADTHDDELNRALSVSGETKVFFARGDRPLVGLALMTQDPEQSRSYQYDPE
jgi:hypothetical protein